MTITVCILVPTGIVLAADSRQITQSSQGYWRVDSDNANKIFRVVAPLGMLIQPGIRVLIDGSALQSELPYTACVAPPNQAPVCIVEVAVDQNFINALKKSQEMWVQVITAQAPPRTIHFIFPTKEFAKVYDGPAMDLKAMEDQRKKMQEKLQKAADDARVEREKQQKQ